jgi:hypothetical protein
MMVFPIRIEHPLDPAIQSPHDANPRKHRRTAQRRDQNQGFRRRLPFSGLMLGLRKLCDVVAGILERDKLAAAWERNWIVEQTFPTPTANGANPLCRIRS